MEWEDWREASSSGSSLFFIFKFKFFFLIFGRTGSSLWHVGSQVSVHRLSYSHAWGILILGPGIESTSPASEGGFLTTGPPETFQGRLSAQQSPPGLLSSLHFSTSL